MLDSEALSGGDARKKRCATEGAILITIQIIQVHTQ